MELRKSVIVDADRESVFRALTDVNELVQWMPQEAKFQARVGGEYEFKYRWDARSMETVLRGKILEYEPNARLAYTWDSQTTGGSARITQGVVTWLLEEVPGGKTKVTLIHSNVADEFRKDAEAGWNHYLSQLARHFGK
jgi:uncharacterized protein YndB with AHSA1/START domain